MEFFRGLNQNENRRMVNVFHCMGGKGRTGTMVSMLLLYSKLFFDSQDALQYFAFKRVGHENNKNEHQFKGAETPSQLRFVGYFEQVLSNFGGHLPDSNDLELDKIEFHSMNSNSLEFFLVNFYLDFII